MEVREIDPRASFKASSDHPVAIPISYGRLVAAGLVGNILEWYDFSIYGYFAVTIGRHFFPSSGPLNLSWIDTAREYLALDARINFFTNYYSVSPGMLSVKPGRGANYLMAFTDGAGTPLSGGGNYRLTLPPKIPAAIFWSVTLYDAENSSGLANGQPFPSLGSRDKPAQNADGSTDLYLGPKAPEGKAGNWLATVPGKGYFAILRLYGPTEAAIDKSWKPGDIEAAK